MEIKSDKSELKIIVVTMVVIKREYCFFLVFGYRKGSKQPVSFLQINVPPNPLPWSSLARNSKTYELASRSLDVVLSVSFVLLSGLRCET